VLVGIKMNTKSAEIITAINISNTETWTSLLYTRVTLLYTAMENDVCLEGKKARSFVTAISKKRRYGKSVSDFLSGKEN
jgi:hypothetical protein